jgi:hypothetical protein
MIKHLLVKILLVRPSVLEISQFTDGDFSKKMNGLLLFILRHSPLCNIPLMVSWVTPYIYTNHATKNSIKPITNLK